jgi:hypothetical protein
MLLVLLAFSVYAEDKTLVAVGSAEELKGITAKKIIWKKDGEVSKMTRPKRNTSPGSKHTESVGHKHGSQAWQNRARPQANY